MLRKLSDATETLKQTRNKLEILAIADAQIYTKMVYRINKCFNDWVQECIMHPTYLDAIHWEVINFRYIISNIKNMYLYTGPLPPRFSTFNATDTKTPKGPSKNEHSEQTSSKKARKSKGLKVQNKYKFSEWKLRDTKELIIVSGRKVQNQPKNAFLRW